MNLTESPVGELVSQRRSTWEQSVDELDASVALEADGVNDAIAASRYGVRDVADLAEQLMQVVPVRVQVEVLAEQRPDIAYVRLAGRGLLFAVPGLFYLVVAYAEQSSGASLTMVIAMLSGWGLSQAVALVAYRVLGRDGGPSAAHALRRIITGALAVAAVALVIGSAVGRLWLAGLATGQILYVTAATVLLFHSADRLLALVLLPGALVSAAYLAGGPVPGDVAVAAVAMTVLAACAAAWYRCHLDVVGTPTGRPMMSDLRASGPFVLEGVLSGVAVAFIPVYTLAAPARTDVHPLDLSIVPLVLSMGFAEIELLRLQAAGRVLMRRTVRLLDYQQGVGRLVVLSQLRFLLVLVTVSVAVGLVLDATSGVNTRDVTLLSAYAVLGTALLGALVLVAVDRVLVALLGFGLAAGVIGAGVLAAFLSGHLPTVEGGYLAGCLVLLTCLTALAVRTLRDPRVLA